MQTFSVAFLISWGDEHPMGWAVTSALNSCQQPLGEASTSCCTVRKGFYTWQQHVISGFYYMFILRAQQPLGGLVMSLGEKDRPALPHGLLAAARREGPPRHHLHGVDARRLWHGAGKGWGTGNVCVLCVCVCICNSQGSWLHKNIQKALPGQTKDLSLPGNLSPGYHIKNKNGKTCMAFSPDTQSGYSSTFEILSVRNFLRQMWFLHIY